MLNAILFPILVVGGLGVLFGIILGIAAIKFRVERDPKIDSIREALPGANCGGCGFAGCDALAEAIATGKAPVNGCPVGGAKLLLQSAKLWVLRLILLLRKQPL